MKLFGLGFIAALFCVVVGGYLYRKYLRWDWERKHKGGAK